ncbi:NAC domain-containing protein 89-like isoform X2 [Macadamia integrifolia]|uniref:NAC domain-containing protein 89-like isoform X2 n=1 Tax=Macadamia integrifolia TaxID=60698 RepID=UPI001C4FAB93|nr:NAC domain-containing protein 89-like isoform X2 [Macadamia integrifolia]
MPLSFRDPSTSTVDTSVFPGFRFCPTDEELISYYLKRKLDGLEQSVQVIPEVDICRFEPWDLPDKSIIPSDNEWFFFCPRDKKYPNGSQTKRATKVGYWKATGKERAVKSGSNLIGTKRTLVFHIGRAPDGERTHWIMHEFSIKGKGQDSFVVCRLRKKIPINANDDNSNSNSVSHGDFAATDDGLSTVAQLGNEMKQTGTHEEVEETECFSMKQGSNSDALFRELCESTSDSVQKLQSNGECSGQKYCDAEDDCFADILNEDIIQLDYSSLQEIPSQLTEITSKQRENAEKSLELPSQGTAKRRIRLKMQVTEEIPEVTDVGIVKKLLRQDARQCFKRVESIFSVGTGTRFIFMIFKIMALLVLFLLVLRCISHLKMFTCKIKL